jgi:hypothetical protein
MEQDLRLRKKIQLSSHVGAQRVEPDLNGPKNPAGFGSLTIGLERYRGALK